MSQANAKQFLAELKENAQALAALEQKKDSADKLTVMTEVANELGIEFTKEELEAAVEEITGERAEKSDSAAKKVVELSEEDIEVLTGGRNSYPRVCSSDFDDQGSCWFDDRCKLAFNYYEVRECSVNEGAWAMARCEKSVKTKEWTYQDYIQ